MMILSSIIRMNIIVTLMKQNKGDRLMFKRNLSLVIAAMLGAVLIACGSTDTAKTTKKADTENTEAVTELAEDTQSEERLHLLKRRITQKQRMAQQRTLKNSRIAHQIQKVQKKTAHLQSRKQQEKIKQLQLAVLQEVKRHPVAAHHQANQIQLSRHQLQAVKVQTAQQAQRISRPLIPIHG